MAVRVPLQAYRPEVLTTDANRHSWPWGSQLTGARGGTETPRFHMSGRGAKSILCPPRQVTLQSLPRPRSETASVCASFRRGPYGPKGNSPKNKVVMFESHIQIVLTFRSKSEKNRLERELGYRHGPGCTAVSGGKPVQRRRPSARHRASSPSDTRYGGFIAASKASSSSQKGFSSKISVYSATPIDHISSSGPL